MTQFDTNTKLEYTYYLEVLNNKVSLFSFDETHRDFVTTYLLKNILFNNDKPFFSLTCHGKEISLFVDQKYAEELSAKTNIVSIQNYKVVTVYDSQDGVSHIGIVSKISKILADSGISLLYVNSFNNNYILVEENNIDKAVKCLVNENFKFME